MKVAVNIAEKAPVRRRHRATKHQPLTRSALDGRTNAARLYDRIVAGIESDLGGRDALTTVERGLIQAFAGASVHVADLNTRLLLGQQIDLTEHAAAISAMVRVASRLGTTRRARDLTPSLDQYLPRDNDAEAAE